MGTRASFALGCVAGLMLASALFLWQRPSAAPGSGMSVAERKPSRALASPPMFTAAPDCVTREQLRAELAGVEGRLHGVGPLTERESPPAPAPVSPPVSAESAAALAKASQLVDLALANRRMTEQDVASLTALASRLTPADRMEIRRRLIVASNRDQLEVDLAELHF
jgi:hypothetical protein